jgi:hypothetical protein
MKRILSVLMSISIVLSLIGIIPLTASAETGSETIGQTHQHIEARVHSQYSLYSKYQYIIPKDWMSSLKGKTLTGLRWYYLTSGDYSSEFNYGENDEVVIRDVSIYLTETSATEMTELVDATGSTCVFEGKWRLNSNNKTIDVDFTSPYAYNGSNLLVTVIDNTGESESSGGGVWGIEKDNGSTGISHDEYFEKGPFSLSTTGGLKYNNIPVTTFCYTDGSLPVKTEIKDIAITVSEPVIGEAFNLICTDITDGVEIDTDYISWYNKTDDKCIYISDRFKENKVYEVTFIVMAKEGCKLATKNNGKDPDVNLTINGNKANTVVSKKYNAYDAVQVQYSFEALKASQPSTQPSTQTQTETGQPEEYTDSYYYLPSPDQANAGYSFALTAIDIEGNTTAYHMSPTEESIEGIPVYKAEIPAYEIISEIYFSILDGKTEIDKVNTSVDAAQGAIIGYDGYPVVVQPTATETQPDTEKPEITTTVTEPITENTIPSITQTTEPETEKTEPTTEKTEPTTAATESTTEKHEPTEQESVPSTSGSQTSTMEATEPVVTISYFFLPDIENENKNYNYKLIVQDNKGTITIYDFVATNLMVDGVKVYSADVPADIVPIMLNYQVYDGETWLGQIYKNGDEVKEVIGNIVKNDGSIVGKEKPTETVSKEPQTDKPTTKPVVTQPAKETPVEPATNTSAKPKVITKMANPMKVTAKAKTVKLKKLKKKAQKVKAIAVKNAKGKVTYKLVSVPKKIKKITKINSKGVITIKKWKKAKKGTYKIKVKVSAKGTSAYSPTSVTKVFKLKIK